MYHDFNMNMYLLIEVWHIILIQSHGNYIEVQNSIICLKLRF